MNKDVSLLTLTCVVQNATRTASSLSPFGITWSGTNHEKILYPSAPDPKKPVTVLFGPSGCGKTSILRATCIQVITCDREDSSPKEERDRVAKSMGNDIGIDEFGTFQSRNRKEELMKFAQWFMDRVKTKHIVRISVTTLDLSVAQVLLSQGARVWDVFRSRWLSPLSLPLSLPSLPLSTLSIQMHAKQCYEIIEVNGEEWWSHFGRYHYMEHQGDSSDSSGSSSSDGGFNSAARTFLLLNEDHVAIGLCATLSGMGIYQLGSGVVREHRTVILPPYQGMGIGQTFVKIIAASYMQSGIGFFSRTKHPALVAVRNCDVMWKSIEKTAGKLDSNGNPAYSHFFVGDSNMRSMLVRDISHTPTKFSNVEKALNLLQKILVGFSSKANSLEGCHELLEKKNYTKFFDLPISSNCLNSCCDKKNNSLLDKQRWTAVEKHHHHHHHEEICSQCKSTMINILDGAFVSRLFKPQAMWWKKDQEGKTKKT